MHVGHGAVLSKTEAMFFPSPRVSLTPTEQQRVLSTSRKSLGTLGSIVHCSLSSEADVDKRIKSATAAFGALRNDFTNRQLDLKLKG